MGRSRKSRPIIRLKSLPPKTNEEADGQFYEYTCGYDVAPDDQFDDNFEFSDVSTLHRPDEVWEYTWTGKRIRLARIRRRIVDCGKHTPETARAT